MNTVTMESTVGQVALHARLLEAAVHQPDGWLLRSDCFELPVEVRTREATDLVQASFVAGPVPAGEAMVSLELNGVPMHVRSVAFDTERCFWLFEVSARFVGR